MVTRLLLSLRKASHTETVARWNVDNFTSFRTNITATAARDHSTPSDTQNSATRCVPKIKIEDSVLELSDFGSKDQRLSGALDGDA